MSDPFPSGQAGEDAVRQEAERAVSGAMRRMAAAAGVEFQAASGPDSTLTVRSGGSAAAIRLAMMLQDSARQRLRDYIRLARRTGETWEQIGAALRLSAEAGSSGVPLGVLAFRRAAGTGQPGQVADFPWRCPSCTGLILDRGPYGGHVDEEEPGHAPGCARHAALLAAYWARAEGELR